ncbi:hypothetical protein PoB_004205900 [Plakobranchus ocellatus]|uniref:Uncharacterized protein n=1 Tax=Plakobranchus ocellatus TaxID=259542 RepID=A0AAV4BB06_9GAST|nr:hypothetical protein PoB_004205900 [Plakobranchus ocellatus]
MHCLASDSWLCRLSTSGGHVTSGFLAHLRPSSIACFIPILQISGHGRKLLDLLQPQCLHHISPGSKVASLTLTPARTSPASPQQGDLRLSGPPSGQDAGGGARTRDRRVPADLRADSLATVSSKQTLAWCS